MPWFKVDDGFHGHPKVVELSLEAVGVWTLSGSWCSSYLTDGEINLRSIRRVGGDKEQADELVRAGLWLEKSPGVYQFKDWEDYQPLKASVEAEREAARERMAAVRAKRKGTSANTAGSSPEPSPDVRPNTSGTFARTSEEVRVTPTQSHPDPTKPPYGGSTREGQTGTRIPADFKPTPHMIAWALEHTPNVNATAATRKFKAHYRAAAGPAQFKADWTAAWEAWLLGDQERANHQPQQFKTAAEKRLEQGRMNHEMFAQMDAERENAAKELTA